MGYALQGIQLGLMLSILVGPLLMIIVQASLEQGARAGLIVGSGVWFSDALYVFCIYFGLSGLDELIKWDGFEQTIGLFGAFLLLIFGTVTLLAPAPDFSHPEDFMPRRRTIGLLWLKGFFVNLLNPFTAFFWVSVISTLVIKAELSNMEATSFFSGILFTIVFTDALKVLLAKRIRNRLKPLHFVILRRVAGIGLIVFGLILFIRVI